MRLYLTEHHPDHQDVWTVCDRDTGAPVATVDQRPEGVAMLAAAYDWDALTAAVEDGTATTIPWESDGLVFEDTETSDMRIINGNALTFRDTPMPLMLQTVTAYGHDGAVIAGRIDAVGRNGKAITGSGVYDSSPDGQEAARLVANGMVTGVSADIAASEVEIEVLEVDEDGWPLSFRERILAGEMLGATQTPFPAFADAQIRLVDQGITPEGEQPESVAAAGAPLARTPIPVNPPVEWFANPKFTEPQPIHVENTGRVLGHVALWGSCHIGRSDTCVTAPHSNTNYAHFTTGAITCEDGCHVPVGQLTFGTGHADIRANARAAMAHYDNTGTVGADVAIGEDEFGIWVAGAMRPGLTDEQLREFACASPSGDWRNIGGSLELVAVLQVNVPGFAVPRARVASGEVEALVAAASPREPEDIVDKIPAWAQKLIDRVTPLALEHEVKVLDARMHR